MPVYNGEKYIRQALDSLLAQGFKDFELIISDNASTDNTAEICLDYAIKDERIYYHHNEINFGSLKNFELVLELSKGDYFMWAADHDLWHPTFISRCVEIMEKDPDVVLCYSRTMRIDPNGNSLGLASNQIDTRNRPPIERFKHFIWNNVGGDLIYGVFKAEAIKQIPVRFVWGPDQAILAELSLKGSFAQIPDTLFYWRKIRDETLDFRKQTVPFVMDPKRGQSMANKEPVDLLRGLRDACLDIINCSTLTDSDKIILKNETMRCFKTRFGVQYGWKKIRPKIKLPYFNLKRLLKR